MAEQCSGYGTRLDFWFKLCYNQLDSCGLWSPDLLDEVVGDRLACVKLQVAESSIQTALNNKKLI